MREIKFRAWDTERNIMAKVNHIGINDYEVSMEDEDCRCWNAPYSYVCKLMQYTGLKDINGKEIYEGDIVNYFKDELAVIKWYKGGFIIESESHGESFHDICAEIEVVGNMYENLELLEKI